MIFIPSKNLKPDMTVARDIWGKNSSFPLIRAGNKLSQKLIDSFVTRGIVGAYIEFEGSEDIEVNELLPMEAKVRVTGEIKRIFQSLQNEKGRSYQNMDALNHVKDYLVEVVSDIDDCVMNMIEIKNYNEYAYVHSMQVAFTCVLIGKELKFSNALLKELAIAGLLHDLGKTSIPHNILEKEGPLTEAEFELIKQHPDLGLSKLSSNRNLSKLVLDGIVQHHERVDGTGYPNNLSGDKISEFAKIIAIADVYDALTTDRSFRHAWDAHKTIEYMISCADSHFDVYYLNAFLAVAAAYPIGILVRLNIGLNAVVIGSNKGLPLNPIIRILTKGESFGKVINLASDRDALTIQITDTIKDEKSLMEILRK
ncbi:MAG: metal dependent phosphohydrolase [Bacillales bacterium]|jgi:HD-GYP domain-containing protein (c-di-GMP phosphodiesterase class II)|nr:metal dependent phosphohydrolase [Bacillales bacterium]